MGKYLRKAVRGAGIAAIMTLLATLLGYLIRIVLSRNLDPTEFGLFFSVYTFILFIIFFRDLGLTQSLVKYIAQYEVTKNFHKIKTVMLTVFTLLFISTVFFGIILWISSGFLAQHYFKNPHAEPMLQIMLIYLMGTAFFKVVKHSFQGFQQIFFLTLADFSKNLFGLLLIILFFKISFGGNMAPALAYTIALPLLIVFFLPFLLKRFPFYKYKIIQFKQTSKEVILFGLPVFVTFIGGRFIGYIDTLLLTHFRTLAEVGIYNVIMPTALIFMFIGSAISLIIFPLSSELSARKDLQRLSKGVSLVHRYVFLLAIPVLGVVFSFSNFLISTFFGAEYAVGSQALQILLIGILFFTIALINNNVISGIGHPKEVSKIILLAAFCNLILNILFIPSLGINGAALATTLSYILAFVYSMRKVKRYVGIRFPVKEWSLLIFPAIGFFAVIYQLENLLVHPWINFIVVSIFAALVYLLLAYLFSILKIEEIKKQLKKIF